MSSTLRFRLCTAERITFGLLRRSNLGSIYPTRFNFGSRLLISRDEFKIGYIGCLGIEYLFYLLEDRVLSEFSENYPRPDFPNRLIRPLNRS